MKSLVLFWAEERNKILSQWSAKEYSIKSYPKYHSEESSFVRTHFRAMERKMFLSQFSIKMCNSEIDQKLVKCPKQFRHPIARF